MKHFSNQHRNVFVIQTPNQVDRGALMSRYSRSDKGMREIFDTEFSTNENRGKEFYEKVLSQFGDDSIAELGQVQIGVENVSNIVAQTIEDRRIGMSFLEKSTRYVPWHNKIHGRYLYYRDADMMTSRYEGEYEELCDYLFETYDACLNKLICHIKKKYPIELYKFKTTDIESKDTIMIPYDSLKSEEDIKRAHGVFHRTVRSMALDTIRGVLPAGTLTNVAIAGNGRSFEYLINILKSSKNPEERRIGDEIATELLGVIGPLISRSLGKYGKDQRDYMRSLQIDYTDIQDGYMDYMVNVIRNRSHTKNMAKFNMYAVSLMRATHELNSINDVVSALVFEGSNSSYDRVRRYVEALPEENKYDIIRRYGQMRSHRRHKPPRVFEIPKYQFAVSSSFGAFRDIHRHRIMTINRPRHLNTYHGYYTPSILNEVDDGILRQYKQCMKRSASFVESVSNTLPIQAQYGVCFAYRYPYMISVNLRELCHIVELRTQASGHEEYQNIAYKMYDIIRDVHPRLSNIIQFVKKPNHVLGRLVRENQTTH